jgi:hypothetical protein
MKSVLISILLGGLMTGVALAQGSATPAASSPASASQSSTPAQPGSVTRIAPGSVIPVSLTKTIDAKKAKNGDEVVAKVTQDMKSTNGEVIVAKDTKMMGHVTEAQPRSKEQKESEVGIAFDRAVLKDGSEMKMPMSIQAIIGPTNGQENGPQNSGAQNAQGSSNGANVETGGSSTGPSGTRSGMGGGGSIPATTSSAPASNGNTPSDAQTKVRPPITAQTQGVVGISNLTLAPLATNSSQGSVVTSEKNNVKLESGTMMLLRVN